MVDAQENDAYLIGQVKWFNNKAGYGFITQMDGDDTGTDVFVHHSAIKVGEEQFKYLVQGEYVNFKKAKSETESHEYQVGEVIGMSGGKLMCETRNAQRTSMAQGEEGGPGPERVGGGRGGPGRGGGGRGGGRGGRNARPIVRVRGPGPRDGEEWMLVKRRRPNNQQDSGEGGDSNDAVDPPSFS
tara:strand:- start:529 stop:1083 length:555 start_codon:yes stop_codon:yes gene_type:complete